MGVRAQSRHIPAENEVIDQCAARFAIAARCDTHQPDESAAHHVDAAESSGRGHMFEAYIRPFEVTTRRLHAHLKHVVGWRLANLSSKHTLEVSYAHLETRLSVEDLANRVSVVVPNWTALLR